MTFQNRLLREPVFALKEQLQSGKQGDSRQSQKACDQGGDCIDGKKQPCEAGDQIQQPQAGKAGPGIDQQFPGNAQWCQAKAQKTVNQKNGDQKTKKGFHIFPPYKRWLPGYTDLGAKRDASEMEHRFKIHFSSRVSPENS